MTDHYKMANTLTDPVLAAIFGAPAGVLMVLMVYRINGTHAMGVRQISQILNATDNTVSKALHALANYGLVANNGNRYEGWYLTADTLQLPLMAYLEAGEPDPPEKSSLKIYDSPPAPINGESQNLRLPPANQPGVSKFTTRESQNLRLPHTTSLSSLKDSSSLTESEELLLTRARAALKNAGCSPDQIEEFPTLYSPERILYACDVYEWARHTRNRKGTGFVANDRGYLINSITRNWSAPRSYIPADRRCAHCWRALSDHAYDCPTLQPNEPHTGSPSLARSAESSAPDDLLASLPAEVDPVLRQAWTWVLDQLGGDVHRADLETWVYPLEPVAYSDNLVTLCAPTTPTRNWVSSRLGKTLENLLSSALGKPITLSILVDHSM